MTESFGSSLTATFHRFVALTVIASMGLTACASRYDYRHQDLTERFSRVTSIAAVPVDVRVLSWGFGGGQFSDEWSENVRSSLQRAIAKRFGRDPRFVVGEINLQNENAQRELDQVRNEMQDIFPEREEVGCLPGAMPSLADAAGTDAILLVVASDRITTIGFRAALVTFGVIAVPVVLLASIVGPATVWKSFRSNATSGPSEVRLAAMDAITLCLVDARKGDTLWFDLEPVGTGDLLDAALVDRLIGNAYTRFKETTHQ
jgi:hypothetical protein